MFCIEEIKKLVKNIDGWLSDKEVELLFNLGKKCSGKGVIVEIGSWKGKSTICLAKGSKSDNKIKVYAIDPHVGASEHKKLYGKVNTFREFENNIKNAEVDDIVIPIMATSEEAAKNFTEPIELIFIDGAHEYELVKLDFELWFPKVINGGIMAFHDTMSGGPKKIVDRYLYRGNKFKNVNFVESITFAEKQNNISLKDKFRNMYILFLRSIYIFYSFLNRNFFNGKLHLPKIFKIVLKKILRFN